MQSNRCMISNNNRRCGAILITALVVLIVVSSIGLSLLQVALAQHRQAHQQRHRVQAEWIAEAGVQRALFQLAKDEKYKGETWSLPDQKTIAANEALIVITVIQTDQKEIQVVATYPQESIYRTVITKTVPIIK